MLAPVALRLQNRAPMRRALLLGLAALAAPAIAAAQTTTTAPAITFTQGTSDIIHGKYVSAVECDASKNAPTSDVAKVNLSWILNPYPAGGSYKLWASTAEITTATCPTSGGTNPVFEAGQVGAPLGNLGSTVNLQPVKFSDIFAAVKITDCAAIGDKDIFVCAQAYDSNGNAVSTGGIATGKITLSTSAPGAPPFANATPADDGALMITWGRPDSTPPAYDYVVTATGRATDTTPHSTGDIVALEYLMKGLVNDVTYDITVVARSVAGNPGPPATTSATVVPVANFWDVYHEPPPVGFGGQEQGGCSAGAAGPVALLGVAALLAALRRRK